MVLPSESFEFQVSEAIESRDAVRLRQLIDSAEFVLIAVADDEEEADEEEASANVFSTELDGMDLLVAFTNEETAGQFVDSMDEEFAEDDEVEGYVLDGNALLDYMPPEHGIYLNPESDDPLLIDQELLELILKAEA